MRISEKLDKGMAGGHLMALFTTLVWGTTFISTKVLLREFEPVEILFYRFALGFAALTAAFPQRIKGTDIKKELTFAGAGLCGVTLYFLLENIALTFTTASNVGVIISAAPFFTAILAMLFLGGEKPRGQFYVGFALAIAGICLISMKDSGQPAMNPKGDLLAALAALVWAAYSVLTKKIAAFGFHTIQTTRRIFAYGLLFIVPALFVFDFRFGPERFLRPLNLLNLLFLGLCASALCFVTWNLAVKRLGAVKTSVYIYMVPVVTVITAALALGERLTLRSGLGTLFTITGLFLSEWKRKEPRRNT